MFQAELAIVTTYFKKFNMTAHCCLESFLVLWVATENLENRLHKLSSHAISSADAFSVKAAQLVPPDLRHGSVWVGCRLTKLISAD
jgi:hypothetical protein